jgi:hypothetical protein
MDTDAESLDYTGKTFSRKVWIAAKSAALQIGYDIDDELILDAEIDSIEQLHPDAIKNRFPHFLSDQATVSLEDFLEVTYTTWSIPKSYDGSMAKVDLENAVISRCELIIVLLPDLMENTLLTYGLGREFNHIEWQDLSTSRGELTSKCVKKIRELIAGEWQSKVQEYYAENPVNLKSVPISLRSELLTTLSNYDDRNIDLCPFCYQPNDHLAELTCEHVIGWSCDGQFEGIKELETVEHSWNEFSAVVDKLNEINLSPKVQKKINKKQEATLIDIARNGLNYEHALYTLKSVVCGDTWSTNGMLESSNNLIYAQSTDHILKLTNTLNDLTKLIHKECK